MHLLDDGTGMAVRVCEVGASIASIRVPDRDGVPGEVVLGFDADEGYRDNPNYFGVTVGRYAGRIRKSRFELDGRPIRLSRNVGAHHLHGGPAGFSHRAWETRGPTVGPDGAPEITFTLRSPDGDQGYPGAVEASVTYRVEPGHRLRTLFRASCDAPTHLSLTNHSYFNLAGRGDVGGHRLRMDGSRYLRLDRDSIPTGEVVPAVGTPWDFTREKGLFLDRSSYDHFFLVDDWDRDAGNLRECAWVREPSSGRTLTVATTLPGIQFYTPDFGDGTAGRSPEGYLGREGFCLETQFLPDSPNQLGFPSTRLDPGQQWVHETVFTFGVETAP